MYRRAADHSGYGPVYRWPDQAPMGEAPKPVGWRPRDFICVGATAPVATKQAGHLQVPVMNRPWHQSTIPGGGGAQRKRVCRLTPVYFFDPLHQNFRPCCPIRGSRSRQASSSRTEPGTDEKAYQVKAQAPDADKPVTEDTSERRWNQTRNAFIHTG